jgi:hypothetical protein
VDYLNAAAKNMVQAMKFAFFMAAAGNAIFKKSLSLHT